MVSVTLVLNLVNFVIMTKTQFNFIKSFADDELLNSFFCPDVCMFIACQIALESAFGTSELSIKQLNYIGMKLPSKRFGCYISPYYVSLRDSSQLVSANFSCYLYVRDCLADYICWVLYNRPSRNDLCCSSEYANWLTGKYCPDSDYIDNITSLYNQFKSYQL